MRLYSNYSQISAFSDDCGIIHWEQPKHSPLGSDGQLLLYFEDPSKCISGETKFREKLPLRHKQLKLEYAEKINIDVLYIGHGLAAGLILTVMAILMFVFALCWTVGKNDISGRVYF